MLCTVQKTLLFSSFDAKNAFLNHRILHKNPFFWVFVGRGLFEGGAVSPLVSQLRGHSRFGVAGPSLRRALSCCWSGKAILIARVFCFCRPCWSLPTFLVVFCIGAGILSWALWPFSLCSVSASCTHINTRFSHHHPPYTRFNA